MVSVRNALAIIFASTLFLVGCSNDPNLLSGVAMVDGVPIEKGRLIITPDNSKGNTGQRVLCDIVDGKFYATPITSGPNVIMVSIHKKPPVGELITMAELKGFKMYTIDIELPEPGTRSFKINVTPDSIQRVTAPVEDNSAGVQDEDPEV